MAAFQPSGIATRGSGPMCPGVLTLWPKAPGGKGIRRESDACCFIITGVGCTEKMYICIELYRYKQHIMFNSFPFGYT